MIRRKKFKDEPEIQRSVNPKIGIQLMKKQIKKAEVLLANRPIDTSYHTAWENTTKDYLIKTFGSKSQNVNAVINASSSVGLYMGMSDEKFEEHVTSKTENQIKMLQSCIEQLETEIELFKGKEKIDEKIKMEKVSSSKIFIVHGRDNEMKREVQILTDRAELDGIVLHELPDRGRTIIDKLIQESEEACYVIALLSPDDEIVNGSSRARQNVILEIGYFLGKLGKERVRLLKRGDVEIPSDLHGILFENYDSEGNWRMKILKEMKAVGIKINIEKVLERY